MAEVIKHPLTGATFTVRTDGLIDVEDPEFDQSGTFTTVGDWVSGELTFADPHMIRWAMDLAARKETVAMAVAGKRAAPAP